MKKRLILLVALCFLILLCACGGAKNDEAFLKNLEKGLGERWTEADSYIAATDSDYRKHLGELVEMELSAIGDVSEYSFDDPLLKDYAEAYYDALMEQKEGCQYYGLDDDRYTEMFTKSGYQARCVVLYHISQDYTLFDGSKYEDTYEEMLVIGRVYLEEQKKLEGLTAVCSDNLTIEALGGTDYKVLFTNDTQYDFTDLTLSYNLYDEDGVLLDTASSYIDNCAAGASVKPSVWISESFTSCEVRFEYYNSTLGQYMITDWVPADYTNEMIVTIEPDFQVPVSVSDYNYSGSLKNTCTITAFSYEEAYWSDGKATMSMYIDGTKTRDGDDDNTSRSCSISWKLYDEDGTVVDSGSFTSNSVATGESFVGAQSYASDLKPGNYRLELLNTSNEALEVSIAP